MNSNHWRKVGLALCAAGMGVGVYVALVHMRPDALVGALISLGVFIYMLNKS